MPYQKVHLDSLCRKELSPSCKKCYGPNVLKKKVIFIINKKYATGISHSFVLVNSKKPLRERTRNVYLYIHYPHIFSMWLSSSPLTRVCSEKGCSFQEWHIIYQSRKLIFLSRIRWPSSWIRIKNIKWYMAGMQKSLLGQHPLSSKCCNIWASKQILMRDFKINFAMV